MHAVKIFTMHACALFAWLGEQIHVEGRNYSADIIGGGV